MTMSELKEVGLSVDTFKDLILLEDESMGTTTGMNVTQTRALISALTKAVAHVSATS